MGQFFSQSKNQLTVAIGLTVVAVLAYVWVVAQGLDSPQVDAENFRARAAHAQADQHYGRAEQLLKLAAAQAEKVDNQLMLSSIKSDQAEVCALQLHFESSEKCLREALACLFKARLETDVRQYREKYLDLKLRLAGTLEKEQKVPEAITTYKEILETFGPEPSNRRQPVVARYNELLRSAGRMKELAEAQSREDVSNGEGRKADTHFYEGVRLMQNFSLTEADREFAMALTIARKWNNIEMQVLILNWSAVVRLALHDLQNAEALLGQARSFERSKDENWYETSWLLSACKELAGDKKAAQVLYKQLGDAPVKSLTPLLCVGGYYSKLGKFAQCNNLWIPAMVVFEKSPNPDPVDIAPILWTMGSNYFQAADYEKSNVYYEKAMHVWVKRKGPQTGEVMDSLRRIGQNYTAMHKYDESNVYMQRSLALWEKFLGARYNDAPEIAPLFEDVAENYLALGKMSESNDYLLRALHVRGAVQTKDLARVLDRLGRNYHLMNQEKESQAYYDRGMHAWETAVGFESKQVAVDLQALGEFSGRAKQFKERDEYYLKAISIFEKQSDAQSLRQAASLLQRLGFACARKADYAGSNSYLQRAANLLHKSNASANELLPIEMKMAENYSALKVSSTH